MRQLNVLILALIIGLFGAVNAQNKVSLTFTGESYDSVYQKLDSVKITNLSRSWSETIVNDTVFTIANHVGIADYAEKAFGLTLGSANESSVEVLLSMPVAGNVNLELYDISGRKLATVAQNLTTGTHSFNVEMQKSQICFLRATSQSGTASIKMLSLGNGSENAISYASLRSNNVQLRHTSTNYFETGDQMQYIGYATRCRCKVDTSYSVTQIQNTDDEIVLTFDEVEGTFTDERDGNVYCTVTIGNQTWMAEDLKYLPSVDSVQNGSEDTVGKYYYVYGYNGEDTSAAKSYTLATAVNGVPAGTNTYETFGVLYNWTAAMGGSSSSLANPSGIQGACPSGWHLPSDAEWKELEMYLGMSQTDADNTGWRGAPVGSKLAGNASLWTNGTLETTTGIGTSGFSALPGGYRDYNGKFYDLGYNGYWWAATEYSSTNAWLRSLFYGNAGVFRYDNGKNYGFSVRCVRNN